METIYIVIVAFLLILAVFDLFVGVSNDAVNFLQSAIGAKAARFRTVLIVASVGVAVGAMMSAGMMDVARHGIMHPVNYSFHEVMVVFLAVMVTDVIILDVFNTLGLPTSTTVSLVFDLLGGTFILALVKMAGDPTLALSDLLNSDKALSVIVAIFVSVAIAFVCGVLVQWLSRIIFTFRTKNHKVAESVFGGISFAILAYFVFIKGLSKSPVFATDAKVWIDANTTMLLGAVFAAATLLSYLLLLMRVSVFRLVVLMGTFALAMAFAGNDLVNFIGVPLAGLSSYQDWVSHGAGNVDTFMMGSLMESAKSPFLYLMIAGGVMIFAMATSKKAQNVVKTSVDLSRQDESDEMFGTSRAARSIVRATQECGQFLVRYLPKGMMQRIDSRFNKEEVVLKDGAAFDMVRAAVNLVLASVLIVIGTNFKLPLSTTYVTFMVAMGTSLADRAWSRESAVFRVTGVLSVIGGWFVTAGVAFATCALVCLTIYFGGFIAMFAFMALAVFLLIRSNIQYARKAKKASPEDASFKLMMRSRDPEIVWDVLCKHVSRTQSGTCEFALDQYNDIVESFSDQNLRGLRRVHRALNDKLDELTKIRRREFLALRRSPTQISLERNTWFHLGFNSNQQYIYCLKRMLDPAKEHVDNNFTPLPQSYRDEFEPMRQRINDLMKTTAQMLDTRRFDRYRETMLEADSCKNTLSVYRKRHIDRMQRSTNSADYNVSLIYLNILQESQELLSIMRHQLRAGKKLLKPDEEEVLVDF
ncbi:MAG: inorganic phosphate transporter [Prevotella sp.]|uniref:Phosphate transporter n=1 Tax=Xylanibacter brevis TaxID=83231 RepID=A0ABS9CCY6_9BACT|nr:inorganic phosphate transporter [Xylanibacter brevis]MCF2562700.1 inorganic phosphate transporter [Xylanibacter brevis]MDY4683535.1 inorganic phosphate transporter [Prevotella sp.]